MDSPGTRSADKDVGEEFEEETIAPAGLHVQSIGVDSFDGVTIVSTTGLTPNLEIDKWEVTTEDTGSFEVS